MGQDKYQEQKLRWGTSHELRFLKGLGGWRRPGSHEKEIPKGERRRILLLKYREAMRTRQNWGDINPKRVMEYVDRELAKAK